MGRLSILGADVFLCLFGVFAVLRALAPQFEFLPERDLILEVFWPASEDRCIADAIIDDRGQIQMLNDPSGRVPFDSGRNGCLVQRPLAEATAEFGFELRLSIPILSAEDCQQLRVSAGEALDKPTDCSGSTAFFTVSFAPGEA